MERHYILFDTPARDLLYPFTHTRPVAAIRVGILTIREKWERWFKTSASFLTLPYLQEKFPLQSVFADDQCVLINGSVLPDGGLVEAIRGLKMGQRLYKDEILVAKMVMGGDLGQLVVEVGLGSDFEQLLAEGGAGVDLGQPTACDRINYQESLLQLIYPWDIFRLNDSALRQDFALLTAGRTSAPISASNHVSGVENIFLEPGAVVEHSILNGKTGPIYIAKGAEVMEGCLIRGALALCEGAMLKMGTKIYGATTLGPGSVGGGEIKNVVMMGYSNKGHDGYLGDAVLGEWCNLGGNTTNSNLKNNASTVRVWVEAKKEAIPAGTKCGLIMGDYSRSGIGTMFNTGTVIGVSCNIFGGEFPPKFVPSFSWGGVQPAPYREQEALRDARQWMQFKGQQLGDIEERLLKAVYAAVRGKS
ncbi:putative sugar nucleotidyl transferase [Chitinophaga sancti]|uniref:putative sugar nucleotidyl transferase n=1 Tax=Chitinophaga sancti TaxID=1004 RepID=UPI002A74FB89|nr:putative sugar nucleotidyl transferase [Chitinophaga sancti]WPQ62081.1 putative sugar nucleotidyl transferase [Chitinophaga sancti]